jgi:hypothetical protein
MHSDVLTYAGGAVKDIGGGTVAGYLITFGGTDRSEYRDEFTPETDYDLSPVLPGRSPIYFCHAMHPTIGAKVLGRGALTVESAGVVIEGKMNLRDRDADRIYGEVKENRHGWSSGTAGHLVRRRKRSDGSHVVLRWPLGLDASITDSPADPRNVAHAIKGLALSAPRPTPDPYSHIKAQQDPEMRAVLCSLEEHKIRQQFARQRESLDLAEEFALLKLQTAGL